jgi:hypothetical protein
MPTQARDGQQVTADIITEQTRAASNMTTQRVQDLMVQLARQGQDISLRSLQVWADLARGLDPAVLRRPAGVEMVCRAFDLFEKLLVAQREVVDELVSTQRRLAQQFLHTAAVGDVSACR